MREQFNERDKAGNTLVHSLAKRGDTEGILRGSRAGAKISPKNNQRQTPLHLAKNAETASVLIACGAFVNSIDIYNRTPLFMAVQNNNVELIKFLLSAGAGATINPKYGTLISKATESGFAEVVQLLIDNGVTVNTENLMDAIRYNNLDITKMVLATGVDPNSLGRVLYSVSHPLEAALKRKDINPEIIWELLKHGATERKYASGAVLVSMVSDRLLKRDPDAQAIAIRLIQSDPHLMVHFKVFTPAMRAAVMMIDPTRAVSIFSGEVKNPPHMVRYTREEMEMDI